jgi:hypothetical protein
VRVLAAEDGLDLDDLFLEVQRLQVVRHGHQVGFGRQLVGRVAPVAVAEGAELAAFDELLQPALQVAEVARAGHRPAADALRQLAGLLRVGLQRADHVDPVQRVQVVEVHQVVVRVQRGMHQVADDVGVVGDVDLQRVFHRAHRDQRVRAGADAADALDEGPGITRVAALEDDLQPAPHRARADRVADDVLVVEVDFDAQVAFDAGDRVDDDALAAVVELEALGFDDGHDQLSTLLLLSAWVLLRLDARWMALTAACATTAAPTRRRRGRSCRRWLRHRSR